METFFSRWLLWLIAQLSTGKHGNGGVIRIRKWLGIVHLDYNKLPAYVGLSFPYLFYDY